MVKVCGVNRDVFLIGFEFVCKGEQLNTWDTGFLTVTSRIRFCIYGFTSFSITCLTFYALMRNLFAFILGCLFSLSLCAQIEYPIFKDSATFRAEDSGKLSLQIDNLNYLRNYEYSGDIPLSYTLLGYQFM